MLVESTCGLFGPRRFQLLLWQYPTAAPLLGTPLFRTQLAEQFPL